jgi:carboxypeptidase Q
MSTAQSNQYSCEGFTTRPHIFLSCLLLLFVCSNLFAQSKQKRQPSTPAERAQAAQIARELETDPLLPGNENMRAWLKLWLGEVPDITIQVCAEEFGPFSHEANRDQKFGSIIFGQSKFSSASFVIEHPDQAKNAIAVYTAGVEGSLKVYQSILKTHPEARRPSLDDLVVKMQNGELAKYIERATPMCGKHT